MNAIMLNHTNHFVLRKQHLTDESRSDDVVQTVRDIGGLHATSPTTPYLSLLSRVRSFTREKLDEELYVKRSLGKIRCVRKTVYILPKGMISTAFAATRMHACIMCDKGLLIRGNPQKGWKSNIHTYYLFHEYFPDVDLNAVDEAKARRLIVEQYLASFGPATENDAAWWTGFPKGKIRQIIRDFQDRVSSVRIPDTKANYLLLSSDRSSLMSMKPPKKPLINILPGLDPYMMSYKDRERYLDQEHYNFIFDRSGNATSTILLDGRVIGVWDFQEPFVKIFLFNDIKATILKEMYSKARNVGTFISGKEVKIKKCDYMIPLSQRTAGGVMSPLKYC